MQQLQNLSMTLNSEKLPISVFVVTLNEEHNIERMLKSCLRLSEIILVDCGSTDATLEIAAKYDVKIFHHEWQGYAKQKQYALEQCQNEWVLNLDADEELNDVLIDKFEVLMHTPGVDGVRCRRNDIFIGKKPARLSKKTKHLRFYKKSKANFDPTVLVHEIATVDGKFVQINETFDHYGYDKIEVHVDKNNKYSSLKAIEKFNKGKKFSYLKLFLVFPVNFLKIYLLQGYIFSGTRGFILAHDVAFYAFTKEAKLYELHQNRKNKDAV